MMKSLDQLALFGGVAAFNEPLHVGRPNIGNRDKLFERLNDILDSNWLTNNGPYVQELEEKLQQFLGVRHCVVTCNGTIALEIAVRALGLQGEVIVPSFTFIATVHAPQWQGVRPVFCDVDAEMHCLDPAKVATCITPRTTGIIGVHMWGHACKVEMLQDLATRHHLRLMFDAAHAFGCSHCGRMIGGFGDAEVFSFHATKVFNSFEGGAIATNNDELARRIRLMKNFGFAGYDDVVHIGTNGKMTEFCAAMGLTSLESFDEFVDVNFRNYRQYSTELLGIAGLRMVQYDQSERQNYQYIVLQIDEAVCGISRDVLQKVLWTEGVYARRYFHPGCHKMEPYRSIYPAEVDRLPVTECLCQCVLCLPTGTAVAPDQIAQICHMIRLVLNNGPRVKEMLRARGILG